MLNTNFYYGKLLFQCVSKEFWFLGFTCFSISFNKKSQKVAPFQRNILTVLNISSLIRHTHTNKQTKSKSNSWFNTHTHHITLSHRKVIHLWPHNPSDLFSCLFNLVLTPWSKSLLRSWESHDALSISLPYYKARGSIPCSWDSTTEQYPEPDESRRGMDVSLLWMLLAVRQRALRRAKPSSRGVLPCVLCLCVISKPQQWGGLGQSSAVAPQKKKRSLKFSDETAVYTFQLSHVCYMFRPSHPSWFNCPNTIRWSVQIMFIVATPCGSQTQE